MLVGFCLLLFPYIGTDTGFRGEPYEGNVKDYLFVTEGEIRVSPNLTFVDCEVTASDKIARVDLVPDQVISAIDY